MPGNSVTSSTRQSSRARICFLIVFSCIFVGDAKDKSFVTIEVRDNRIIQARAKFNELPSEEIMKTWADILRTAWEPLGVRLVVQVVPFDRYLNSIPSWNADLFSYSWIGDFADPMAFLELFHGGSTLNVAGFADSTFDSLLQNASNAENSSERFKLLSQAEASSEWSS